MSRRLSQVIASGLRALSLSSSRPGNSNSSSSQGNTGADWQIIPGSDDSATSSSGSDSVIQEIYNEQEQESDPEEEFEQQQQQQFDDQQEDPFASYRYGELQWYGEVRRRWIENPDDTTCPIQGSTLTIENLRSSYVIPNPRSTTGSLNEFLIDQLTDLGLPNPFTDESQMALYRVWNITQNAFIWGGSMGGNMISIDEIRRQFIRAPHMSEVTLALFRSQFNLNDLRHIFVTVIVNEETDEFITRYLYTEENGLRWPVSQEDVTVESQTPRTWEYGTPEYDALLGTRIGNVVACIVLGGFYRGSTRISRIVTWPGYMFGARPNMRFDIEPL